MIERLIQDIKRNCDISDARFWGYFSVCGLLMRYRDLYRSEQELSPWARIPQQDISLWIQRKEAAWPVLETEEFRPMIVGEKTFSPFDAEGVNEALRGSGMVYGAGYGMYLKPTFFLARITERSEVSNHRVYTTSRELVRDLFTAPAMHLAGTIFIRIEPLTALLWDKFCQLRPGAETILAAAYRGYGMTPGDPPDNNLVRKLGSMAQAYAACLLRHELAESRESVLGWKTAVSDAMDRKTEHFLRAVQDLVADTSDAGPLKHIIDARDTHLFCLAAGLPEGYRKLLFPELRDCGLRIQRDSDWTNAEEVRRAAHERFLALRKKVLDLLRHTERDAGLRGLAELIGKTE